MGIQDRDYYRDDSRGFLEAWGQQGVTVWLIAITTVVFFLEYLGGQPQDSFVVKYGCYSPELIQQGEVWRLVTSLFLHADFIHILFNMLVLYWAGTRMEELYGSREFLAFYLIAGVFAGLITLGAQVAGLWPMRPAVGASGAVIAAMILFAFHYPHQQVLLFFVLPMPIWAVAVLVIVLNSLGALGVGAADIGYFAHLGGALFGLVYYQTGIRFTEFLRRSGRNGSRARPALRVVPADIEDTPEPVGAAVENQPRPKEKENADEHLEAKLDQVLEKVSKHGQESLTPEEREILFKASELYKKRRK